MVTFRGAASPPLCAQDGGTFGSTLDNAWPRATEPPALTATLRSGDCLILTATTKHAVRPNLSRFNRTLLFQLYSVGGKEDTLNHYASAQSLLQRASSSGAAPRGDGNTRAA